MEKSLELCHFISIVFFGAVFAVSASENPCNPWQHMFYVAENRALHKFAYMAKTVRSCVICGRECSMDEACKSFNFYECNKLCELNNLTRKERPNDFSDTQRSVYFDADEDTPLFSLADSSFDSYRSCKMFLDACYNASGVYTIYPNGMSDGLRVYCDMETDGGGWIVFQRRQDGSVDFYRNWTEYQSGFGGLTGEFWLGNDNLVTVTSDVSRGSWELRVDMEDWDNNTAWTKYTRFQISQGEYTLSIGAYDINSTAGPGLGENRGFAFTTKDNDNDGKSNKNCAQLLKGGWWFNGCSQSNLNGIYHQDGNVRADIGILWRLWKGDYSLKGCSIKMRELTGI